MMDKKYNRRCFCGYVLVWMICIFVYSMMGCFVANDGFWHMAIGRHIWNTGSVPVTAVGAWGGESLSWLPQEWLYEWLVYGLFHDNMLLMCFSAVVLISLALFIVGVLSGLHKDIFKKPYAVTAYIAIGVFVLLSFSVPRPQTVSIILMIFFVYCLRKVVMCDVVHKRDYFIFAVLGVFWANIHAGTVILSYLIPLGIALCYTITDKFSWFQRHFEVNHGVGAVQRVSWIACIMLGACLCTPHGISGLLYPLHSLGDTLMLNVITEWAQPNINDMYGLIMYYIPFVVFYGWLYFSKVKMKLFDIAVITFLFLMAVLHLRLTLYLLPVLLLLWIPYLSDYNVSIMAKCTMKSRFLIPLCLVFFVLSIGRMSVYDLSEESYGDKFWQIVKENAGDRIYNYYDFGSIMQYYDIPVFVDARYDPFSKERMPDFVHSQYLDSESEDLDEIMQRYDFTSVLSQRNSHVVKYAENHGFKKMAELDMGNMGVDMAGDAVESVYEFWVKE